MSYPPVALRPGFPANVVTALMNTTVGTLWSPSATAASGNPVEVFGRPLRPEDPNASIGIFPTDWTPVDWEIGMVGPSISRYIYEVQLLVKNSNEQDGRFFHGNLSKQLRAMLYQNTDLKVTLGRLTEEFDGQLERTTRWGVQRQKFFSNNFGEIGFLFLSTMIFWVETESSIQ